MIEHRTPPGRAGHLPRPIAMIVCSCNVFSDADVRAALAAGEGAPRAPAEVYGCLGCSPQCGRCARTIRRIMDEALASAAGKTCGNGCTCCLDAGDTPTR